MDWLCLSEEFKSLLAKKAVALAEVKTFDNAIAALAKEDFVATIKSGQWKLGAIYENDPTFLKLEPRNDETARLIIDLFREAKLITWYHQYLELVITPEYTIALSVNDSDCEINVYMPSKKIEEGDVSALWSDGLDIDVSAWLAEVKAEQLRQIEESIAFKYEQIERLIKAKETWIKS